MNNTDEDPVAVSVQQVLDRTVDVTAQKLESLQESQQALQTQLTLLTSKLESYNEQTTPFEIQQTVDKIAKSRRRLVAVNNTLHAVHQRLKRVKTRLE